MSTSLHVLVRVLDNGIAGENVPTSMRLELAKWTGSALTRMPKLKHLQTRGEESVEMAMNAGANRVQVIQVFEKRARQSRQPAESQAFGISPIAGRFS